MIDFFLQLLHILVHGISVGRVSGKGLAELSFKATLGLCNLLINLLDNLVHLLAFADLTKNVPLELQHWLLNYLVVEVDHVRGDLLSELRVGVHNWHHLVLSESISIDMVESLVAELSTAPSQVLIATNNSFESQLNMEVLVFVVGEADTVFSILLLYHVWTS